MKKVIFTLTIFTFLFCGMIENILAFHQKIVRIDISENTASPAEGYLGIPYLNATSQPVGNETSKNFAVFSTQYSEQNIGQTCTLDTNWNEALSAGIAKIIEEYSLTNLRVSDAENNQTFLNKNLQITLAINQFLLDKGFGNDSNKVKFNMNYYEPRIYFKTVDGISTQTVLDKANAEYNRVKSNEEISAKININRDDSLRKILYNPANATTATSSNLEVETTNIDRSTLSLKIYKQTLDNGPIPEGIEIEAYVSSNANDFGAAKGVLNHETSTFTIADVPNEGNFYIKFILKDNRVDKSEDFKITAAAAITAQSDYSLAAEYNCGDNYARVTPNRTDPRIISVSKGFTFKTPGIPDYPIVQIIDKDSSDSSILLNNAKYKISHTSNGETIETSIKTGTQGNVGKALYEEIEENGTYCIQEELAPSGYLLDTNKYCFNVNLEHGNGYSLSVTPTNNAVTYDEEHSLITLSHSSQKNSITLGKINSSKSTESFIRGAKLKLTRKTDNGEEDYLEWNTADELTKTLVGLPKGTYYLYELEAPSGYILNTKRTVVTSMLTDTEPKTYTIDDSRTKIRIRKIDEQQQLLSGVTLQITDLQGNIVIEPWVTGQNGETEHVIIGLDTGKKYYLEELSAPKGYTLAKKIRFQLSSKGDLVILDGESSEGNTVIITNKKELSDQQIISNNGQDNTKDSSTIISTKEYPDVYISIQDITNKGVELPGAHLVLKDQNGNEIHKWESGEESHVIEGLKKGIYTVTEITAPDGYSVAESITFTIDEEGNITGDTVMYNTPIPEVPATSAFQSILFIIIGVVLVSSGVGLYIYGIKKKKEI